MGHVQPLNDDEREELIAYLDGELALTDAHSVERRLTADPKYRAEADALRKTWNLLDYVPRPEPSANFTNRTMTRVAAPRPGAALLRHRWTGRLAWAAAVLLAAVGGYRWLPAALKLDGREQARELDLQMVRDLWLLEQMGLYQHVPDVQFLNELDRPELFGDDQGF